MKAGLKRKLGKKPTSPGLSTEQVADALRHVLTSTLALYVLANAKKPMSLVVRELMEVELNASQLVGMIMRLQAESLRGPELEGVLAGVFSFIPTHARSSPQESQPGESASRQR